MARIDRHQKTAAAIPRSVLEGPGKTPPSVRQEAARGAHSDAAMAAYLTKVQRAPLQITDEEVAALRLRYDDDTLFELTAAATIGASWERLEKGLSVLDALDEN